MDILFRLGIGLVIAMVVVMIIMPRLIPLFHRLKFGQTERTQTLENHKLKSGTPTMGGTVFVLGAVIGAIITNINDIGNTSLWLITLVLVGFSAIGFADDFLIIKYRSNKGLIPILKFSLQAVLAIICYLVASNFVPGFTSEITLPIVNISFDLGMLYPLLVFFMLVGASNGVNLSDGLDGLATGLMMIAIAPFIIFALMTKDYVVASYGFAMIGGLIGFMFFNYHPAKIFMGDVGSLGLGAFLAMLAILTKQEILLLLVGGVFVLETLSVIIQVGSMKLRGKRVFLMAPIHHHFEMLGWSEQQVTILFWFIGFVCGIVAIVIGAL